MQIDFSDEQSEKVNWLIRMRDEGDSKVTLASSVGDKSA
jgi:hypothetical protein